MLDFSVTFVKYEDHIALYEYSELRIHVDPALKIMLQSNQNTLKTVPVLLFCVESRSTV